MVPVKELREMVKKAKAGGESWASLSLRTGVGTTVLLRFAKGEHDLGGESLEKIARAFGLMPTSVASQRTIIALARMLSESRIDPATVDSFLKKHEKAK